MSTLKRDYPQMNLFKFKFVVQPQHVSVDLVGRIQIVQLWSEACSVCFDLR